MQKRKFIKNDTAGRLIRFEVEERGLLAIRETYAIRVPEVYGVGIENGRSYISMQYIEPGPRKRDFFEVFGRNLALMHLSDTSHLVCRKPSLAKSGDDTKALTGQSADPARFGFFEDGFIGQGEQPNTPTGSWVEFFCNFRLRPMYKLARVYMGRGDQDAMERLLSRLGDYLSEPAGPSLLHGDLWGGNFLTGPDGQAWLIDPAAYVGHFEADLAMTELFGSLPSAFYDAYSEITPIEPEYSERRDIYNLYHILNHLNIFGASYLASAISIIRRYAG